jgi:hypothetical protein
MGKQEHKLRRGSGVVLILVGLLCFANVLQIAKAAGLSWINYVDIWTFLSPGSTDSANPNVLTQGTTITLTAELLYESGGFWSDPYSWTVTVEVYKASTKQTTVTLWCSYMMMGTTETWTGSWAVPADEATSYSFVWKVHTLDAGDASKTTYGKTSLTEPDGVFKINGKDTSQTSSISVISPDISITFSPSKSADKITSVDIKVFKDSAQIKLFTLTKQTDGSYTGTYTLPGTGAFEIQGYISWNAGNPLRKMDLFATWGEEALPAWFGFNQTFGLIFMVVGAILAAKR